VSYSAYPFNTIARSFRNAEYTVSTFLEAVPPSYVEVRKWPINLIRKGYISQSDFQYMIEKYHLVTTLADEIVPKEESEHKATEKLRSEVEQLVGVHKKLFTLVHKGKSSRRALQKKLEQEFADTLLGSQYKTRLGAGTLVELHTNLNLDMEETQLLKDLYIDAIK
jgi:hypothetical protein